MNNQRRAKIKAALKLINEGKAILEKVRDEEYDCFENLSEGLQYTEKGAAYEENADAIDEYIDKLEETDEIEDM